MPRFCIASCVVAGLLLAAGCGLPKEAATLGERAVRSVAQASGEVKKARAALDQLRETEEYKTDLAGADKREDWDAHLVKAEESIAEARDHADTISAIIAKNDKKGAGTVNQLASKVTPLVETARREAKIPGERIEQIRAMKKEGPAKLEAAGAQVESLAADIEDLSGYAERVKEDYPEKAAAIDEKLKPARALAGDAAAAYEEAEAQLNSDTPDFGLFADACAKAGKKAKEFGSSEAGIRKELEGLYKSYTKILEEMKTEPFVQVLRTSWYERSRTPPEKEHLYDWRPVDNVAFAYFDNLTSQVPLATYMAGQFGGNAVPKIEKQYWDALKLDVSEGWISGHDTAVFSLAGTKIKFFHKYTIIEGEEKKETDWEEVTAKVYEENLGNLKMALVEKPEGMFESEGSEEPAPPGMALVDNPKYGEWEERTDGTRAWRYYPIYYGHYGPYYRRPLFYGEYSAWRNDYRNRKPYYGDADGGQRLVAGSGTKEQMPQRSKFKKSPGKFNARAYSPRATASRGTTTKTVARTTRSTTSHSVRGAGSRSRGGSSFGGGK